MFGANHEGRWDKNLAQAQLGEHIKNVIAKYREASPEMVRAGHEWYGKAHEEALKVGKGDAVKGAGIIAALSPQTGWARNIAMSHELISKGTTGATEDNVRKALRIHEGEHPDEVLGGHKVKAFFHNIANPDTSHEVTIDRHAYDVAVGRPFVGAGGKSDNPNANLGLGALGRYKHFVHAYKNATEQLGVDLPHKVQAATWVTHRGAVG